MCLHNLNGYRVESKPEPQRFKAKFITMRMKLLILSAENVKPKRFELNLNHIGKLTPILSDIIFDLL